MQTEQEIAMDTAKVQLIARPDSVFITTILFSLRFSWDETIPTACTNGTDLRVSPQFFLGLDKEERMFLLAHEAYHVAFMHMARAGERHFRTWNIAADYVINDMLIQSGMKMPEGGLHDTQYSGMTSEEVYDLISQMPEDKKPKSPDDMEQIEGTDAEQAAADQEIQDIVVKASLRAKAEDQAGTIPGEVETFLDNLLSPKLPWHKILKNIFSTMAKNDYSYRRPNRRFMPDFYLPSLYSEALGEISVAVDISGSITQKEFDQFISEIHDIHTKLKPSKTSVISFDTKVTDEYTIEEAKDIIGLRFKGGGGTDIEPVLDWANERQPKAIVIFTDGCFELPNQKIPAGFPVFWIIHGSYPFHPKRGKVIRFE